MSLADIIHIIIGVLSLVETIAVSFLIYWLQSRHEKEIQKLQCEKERIASVSYTHLDVYKRQIVEKCENGTVYTVEGNSGDACKQRQYAVGSLSLIHI